MHELASSLPFELEGHFGGFVFTDAGKRRMLLRQEGREDRLLKVTRLLRHRIIGKFRPGEPIRVAGTAERDPFTGVFKWIVSRVLPDAAPALAAAAPAVPTVAVCSVRVCAKKNCWRSGGRELFDALQTEVRSRGLEGRVALRQVGCLDRCKHGPNADQDRHEYSRCSPPTLRRSSPAPPLAFPRPRRYRQSHEHHRRTRHRSHPA